MSELDGLIDELFPSGSKGRAASSAPCTHTACSRSEWDDDDGDDDNRKPAQKPSPAGEMTSAPPSTSHLSSALPTTALAGSPTAGRSAGNGFDDESDADDMENLTAGGSGIDGARKGNINSPDRRFSDASSPHAQLFTVPFPSLSVAGGSFACPSRCYLTNDGAIFTAAMEHPTLTQLRRLAENEPAVHSSSHNQVMLRKGAFHAVKAKLGNGCLDHHGDFTSDGGCSHILCRRCNYMVIRLQGAVWYDAGGKVNLYLTLRNYYPDWCRLASATPVGVEDNAESSSLVLRDAPSAAAYCCQCSWVTVRCPKAVIETRLTDVATLQSINDDRHPFLTEFPPVAGEKRRPPLWVCHGHLH